MKSFSSLLLVLALSATGHAQSINVKGSSTIFPIAKKVIPSFSKETGVTVALSGGGSSDGVRYALADNIVGMASRSLKDKEKADGAVAHKIGSDGIALVVHVDSPIKNLTTDQINKIFSGQITNWADLGGSGAVEITGPGKQHGTYSAFVGAVGLKKTFATDKYNTFETHRHTMKYVETHPGAIGIVAIGQYEFFVQVKKRFAVKAISVDGVKASSQTVSSGQYGITRPLNLVTKGAPSGDNKKFVDFMLNQGQAFVKQMGFIPN